MLKYCIRIDQIPFEDHFSTTYVYIYLQQTVAFVINFVAEIQKKIK